MTVLADIRTLARRDLHDEDATNYRWTDAELDRHIARALRELSAHVPLEQSTAVATVAGNRSFTLAAGTFANRVSVDAIEYPAAQWPRAFVPFQVFGDTVTLLLATAPTGDYATVYWSKLHTLDASSSTLAAFLEDILVDGASAYAALAWSSFATNRINIAGPQAQRDYERWARERLEDFRDALLIHGRRRRLRSRRLYVPESAPLGPTETTDPGPQ